MLIEFELDGERYTDDKALFARAICLLYPYQVGTLPFGVTDGRIVAVDGVYRPMAEDLELRRQ